MRPRVRFDLPFSTKRAKCLNLGCHHASSEGFGSRSDLELGRGAKIFKGSGWRGWRSAAWRAAGPGPVTLDAEGQGLNGRADCRTTRSPDEFAHLTAVTKEAAPLCNSLLTRHSDEMAPARLWGGLAASCLRKGCAPKRSCRGYGSAGRRDGAHDAPPVGLTYGDARGTDDGGRRDPSESA